MRPIGLLNSKHASSTLKIIYHNLSPFAYTLANKILLAPDQKNKAGWSQGKNEEARGFTKNGNLHLLCLTGHEKNFLG
jgi:hypothetical protein